MKRTIFFFLTISIFISSFSPSFAAPGDTVTEAFTAHLGEQHGTLDAYNDVEYYNFTATKFQYYNFTVIPDPNNYNTISIFDGKFNLIANNFTGTGSKSLILIGYEDYIIGIYASEFMETIPGDYSLVISETEIEVIPGPALDVDVGSRNDTFELYNDINWYNFSGSIDRMYEFKVTYTSNTSYTGLYLYDSDFHIIEWSWKVGSGNSINQTGNDIYLIGVVSSEFVIFPLNYTLTISDITPEETIISSSITDSNSQTSTSQLDSSSTSSDALPLNWVSVILGIQLLSLSKKKLTHTNNKN